MLDADCDPVAVSDAFAGDPVIGPLVRAVPGLRVIELGDSVEAAATLDPRHLVLRDQRLHAGPHALDDGIASGGELGVVDLRLTGQVQPEVLGMPDTVGECSRLEQGLGRDAAAMQACAADLVLIDEGDLQPELGRTERGRIAACAGAEDHEVEVIGGADSHRPESTRGVVRGANGLGVPPYLSIAA